MNTDEKPLVPSFAHDEAVRQERKAGKDRATITIYSEKTMDLTVVIEGQRVCLLVVRRISTNN